MSSAAATACTRTPRCRLRRTAASLNSALYSWTFFGPARGTRHLPLLGGSVYKSEAGSPVSFKRLLGRCSPMLTPTGLTLYRPAAGRPPALPDKGLSRPQGQRPPCRSRGGRHTVARPTAMLVPRAGSRLHHRTVLTSPEPRGTPFSGGAPPIPRKNGVDIFIGLTDRA